MTLQYLFLALLLLQASLTFGSQTSTPVTESPPETYALSPETGTIYFKGEKVFELFGSSNWRFTCLSDSEILARPNGTKGLKDNTRIVPTTCSYEYDMIYGNMLKQAAWKVEGNERVFFVLDDGPGGSLSNISYSAISFIDGRIVADYKPFYSGEYFRFYAYPGCVTIRNEYDLTEGINFVGNCSKYKPDAATTAPKKGNLPAVGEVLTFTGERTPE